MHSLAYGFSLLTGMRDLLNLGKTKKEIRDIINHQDVMVDGKKRKDHRFNFGFMDVLSLPKIKKSYRVVFDKEGKLAIIEVQDKEASLKLVRIRNKTKRGKQTQLNVGDGRNILVDKDTYKVNDSLLIELPKQAIKEHYPLQKGSAILLTGGRHSGAIGTVESIEGSKLIFKTDKDLIETHAKHAFVVGKGKSAITIQ
jgi:small subunit ribosomal protein S4e